MKILIVYASVHHGNTKKIAEAAAKAVSADLLDVTLEKLEDVGVYDLVGIASGVFYHGLHEKIKDFISAADFRPGQKVFFLVTCGVPYRDYSSAARRELKKRQVECLSVFQCRGFDTFGVFGKFGGIAKGHPDQTDIAKAETFVKEIVEKAKQGK